MGNAKQQKEEEDMKQAFEVRAVAPSRLLQQCLCRCQEGRLCPLSRPSHLSQVPMRPMPCPLHSWLTAGYGKHRHGTYVCAWHHIKHRHGTYVCAGH